MSGNVASITDALFGSSKSAKEGASPLDFTPVQKTKPGVFSTRVAPSTSNRAATRPRKHHRQQEAEQADAAAAAASVTDPSSGKNGEKGKSKKKPRLEPAAAQETAAVVASSSSVTKSSKRHKSHKLDDHEAEDDRTVFVGNLPNNVTKKEVEKIFKDCGAIESVRIRSQVLARPAEGDKNRGRAVRVLRGEIETTGDHSSHAYVLFATRSPQVSKALQMNGLVFNNRHIIVTKEDPASKAFPPPTSIFIGNIAFSTSDEAVWGFFDQHGFPVKRVRIIRDPETGLAKGFGYVEFQTAGSVNKAIALRGTALNGREIRICHVQKSKDPRIGQMQRRDKRKLENKAALAAGPNLPGKQQSAASAAQEAIDEAPAWMGTVTNPRKKLARDLRPLVEPNRPKDKKPRSNGAPSSAKKSAAPPAKKTAK